jgi:hypothetical protein
MVAARKTVNPVNTQQPVCSQMLFVIFGSFVLGGWILDY